MIIQKITNHYNTYGLAHTLSRVLSYADPHFLNPAFLIRASHDKLSKSTLWQKPIYLQIEPTNLCNLNCASCSRCDRKKFGKMSFSQFNHIISQFDYLKKVKLQGMGEPLLNPDFFLMLEELKKRGITTYCATNGTVLHDRNCDLLLQFCDSIEVSLDSPVKDEAESLRAGLDFEKLLENIKTLVKKNKNREIKMNYVLTDRNFKQVEMMADLLEELGISYLNVVELQNWGHDNNEIFAHPAKSAKKEILKKCYEYAKNKGVTICFSEKLDRFSDCPWYKKRCFITWDGYVTPCCLRPNPDKENMGNIFSEDIDKILNGSPYCALRGGLSREKPTAICRGCSLIKGDNEK